MDILVTQLARRILHRCGVTIMSNNRYQRLSAGNEELLRCKAAIELIIQLPGLQAAELLEALPESKAQLFQDLFVLSELKFKRNGFFVEFGATNGIDLSNTFLLEKQFGWKGILAEPGSTWHSALRENRNCYIETACVWRESNSTLEFNATDLGEFSTIDSFSSLDLHAKRRERGMKYTVQTISLTDLLDKYKAPEFVDYLSIDTEGSEYDILEAFDFEKYRFGVITCEHNFTPQREKLHSLLSKNGYVRKLVGNSDFDDWYVSAESCAPVRSSSLR